jgi:hypothetical protein
VGTLLKYKNIFMPNLFSQPGSLFPHTTSQSTWHFSLGENFLHLSDGTNTYSFIGRLDLKDATLKKVPDVPLADFYSNATSKGKAQVHSSDPSSIYFTLQDGRKNPTCTLRHVDGDTWSVQQSGGGLQLIEIIGGKVLHDEARISGDKLRTDQSDRNECRERNLLFQELVSTDPVNGKFPTHHVLDAYQQMLRIAPELSSEREVVRAFLSLAGATQQIDKSQADALIAANVRLFKLHQASKQAAGEPEENTSK